MTKRFEVGVVLRCAYHKPLADIYLRGNLASAVVRAPQTLLAYQLSALRTLFECIAVTYFLIPGFQIVPTINQPYWLRTYMRVIVFCIFL